MDSEPEYDSRDEQDSRDFFGEETPAYRAWIEEEMALRRAEFESLANGVAPF
jgi:hypothetical protein